MIKFLLFWLNQEFSITQTFLNWDFVHLFFVNNWLVVGFLARPISSNLKYFLPCWIQLNMKFLEISLSDGTLSSKQISGFHVNFILLSFNINIIFSNHIF